MRSFIENQIKTHGTFDKALQAYEEKTGEKGMLKFIYKIFVSHVSKKKIKFWMFFLKNIAPPLLINDPVLDNAFARVGIPNIKEPSFLWDGTSYMGEEFRPPTFIDGKTALPQPPTFYAS